MVESVELFMRKYEAWCRKGNALSTHSHDKKFYQAIEKELDVETRQSRGGGGEKQRIFKVKG